MCLAIPGKLVELLDGNDGRLALVDVLGVERTVDIALLENQQLAAGDWVLIHLGFAMSKIDAAEAAEVLSMLEMMDEATFTDAPAPAGFGVD